jgi:hypothetical protein
MKYGKMHYGDGFAMAFFFSTFSGIFSDVHEKKPTTSLDDIKKS